MILQDIILKQKKENFDYLEKLKETFNSPELKSFHNQFNPTRIEKFKNNMNTQVNLPEDQIQKLMSLQRDIQNTFDGRKKSKTL
jgi:hypothetical protein